jgi:hypothetical protein
MAQSPTIGTKIAVSDGGRGIRMRSAPLAGLLVFAFLFGGTAPESTTLAERYKSGRIVLRADEDWTPNLPRDLVFESRGDICVAPDGSVFVSNTTRHAIFKFDPAGKFVRSFGRPGQGPGDLTNPGYLSVLDGKYLVVGESPAVRRISVFDLDGNFVKIITPGRSANRPLALRDGKIAYVSHGGRMEQSEMINIDEVFIIDGTTGAQKSVAKHEIGTPMVRANSGSFGMPEPGAVLVAGTADGGLAVGMTRDARVDLFSADGAKLRTIDTGWKAVPVTSEYRARVKAVFARRATAEGRTPVNADPLLHDTLDIVVDILADADGNILVCKKTECLEDCSLSFRVYSRTGDFLCESELDPGPFVLSAGWRFKRISITGTGIIGLYELKNDPDGYLRLARTVFASR